MHAITSLLLLIFLYAKIHVYISIHVYAQIKYPLPVVLLEE